MNAYEILGVSPGATLKEIINAYRKLALKHHPDKGGSKEKFQEISEAYNTLMSSAPKAPRRKFQFSNKPGSNKFEEFEEMLKEVEKNLDKTEREVEEVEESLNREQERV